MVSGSAGGGVAIGVEVGLGVRVGSGGSGVSVGDSTTAVNVGISVEVGLTWGSSGPSTGVIKTLLGSWLDVPGLLNDQGINMLKRINKVKRLIFIIDQILY